MKAIKVLGYLNPLIIPLGFGFLLGYLFLGVKKGLKEFKEEIDKDE